MPIQNIQISPAYRLLQSAKGLIEAVPIERLEQLAKKNGNITVSNLRRFFTHAKFFKEFKERLAMGGRRSRSPSPGRSRSPSRSPSRSRSRSPSRRRPAPRRSRLSMETKLGSRDVYEYGPQDAPSLFIQPAGDECDPQDVNLPLPVCQGLRRVCRQYGKDKRYRKFQPDSSENKKYDYDIDYLNINY